MGSTKTLKAGIATAGLLVAGALALSTLSAAAHAGQADPTADASARNCPLSAEESQKLGPAYVTSLKVSGVSCGDAKGVVRAFHDCRHDNGGKDGKCRKKVQGYQCNEGKRNTVPGVQFQARVRCNNDGKRIIHQYSEFL